MIKPLYHVRLIGRASSDATMEVVNTAKGERPVCKFRMWVGSGKNRKTDKYQTPFFFNVKVWGDQAQAVKKDQDIELFGSFTRNEYEKNGELKTWDEVVVETNERGDPMINFAGMDYKARHVSDEAISQGKAKVIQQGLPPSKPQSDLEITDDDIPF